MNKVEFVTDRILLGFFIVAAITIVGAALGLTLYKILAAYGCDMMAAVVAAGKFIGVVLGIEVVLFFVGYLVADVPEKVEVLLNDGD